MMDKSGKNEIVTYFFEMVLSELSKILILFIIFFVLGYANDYLLLFTLLVSSRSYVGGIHAKTYFGCLVLSFCFFAMGIWLVPMVEVSPLAIYVMLGVYVCTISCIAPIQSNNRLIMQRETRMKRKKLIVITSIILICVLHLLCKRKLKVLLYVYYFQLIGVLIILKRGDKKRNPKLIQK